LEQAERIADELETKLLSDSLVVMMSNPRKGTYVGADFERIYINYFKAVNYFALAEQAESTSQYLTALDGARVESRRLIMRLNEINDRKGNYAAEDEEEQKFRSLLRLFDTVLRGNLIDLDSLKYRDDAMAHYLTGLSFEMNREYDNARISYQRAATSYERGYAKQYLLGEEIVEQAWFDTIRMMRLAGNYQREWPRLAKKKLSTAKRAELDLWQKDSAQLVVLEHKGLMPQRKEMNLVLSLNQDLHAIQLRPLLNLDDEPGLAWFYLLYADKGIAGAVTAFMDAKNYGVFSYGFTKTVPLGPLWHTAADLGLIDAMSPALRVAIPYYEPMPALPNSYLLTGGQKTALIKSSNPGLIAIQEQMVSASVHINQALSRSALKAIMAQQLEAVNENYGALFALAGKIAMQFTDAAETRNWLLLPQDIRLKRIALEPGEHEVKLNSEFNSQQRQQQKSIKLAAGEIYLWQVRSLP
ncbi:MAG TPA: hypothetical protein VL020_04250, partial [Pseudomonadales bacterium]|nr:hypothetical protein [Pseudomonadales bacterium]